MGNSGKNSNSSQFFFTLHAQGAPQCDGKHVIFGECISGQAILHTANTYGRQEAAATNGGDATPTVPITITDCGVYQPLVTPGILCGRVVHLYGPTPCGRARPYRTGPDDI